MDSKNPYNNHSRRSSLAHSTTSAAHSTANSTRPILMSASEQPMSSPFGGASFSGSNRNSTSNVSLSVNYLPSKLPSVATSPALRKRKGGKGLDSVVPKLGGGLDAFKSGEARMGGENDDSYGANSGWYGKSGQKSTKPRWNKFKWILFFANLCLTVYSIVGLIFSLLVWFNVFKHADIVRVGNQTELVFSTLAACIAIITAMIGWAGIFLNNRSFLAVYTFLTWIVLAFLVIPGYLTYKRRSLNLEGKINSQWSTGIGVAGRLRIQNELQCCGYFSPYVEATVSQLCYARSVLPGCKLPYMDFQKMVLKRWYTVVFALVPLQIFIMICGLLCSNHVTYRFGKGMMPKAYRLSMNSMAVIMDNYANQLAEQYGSDVASDIMARSRSNLHLDAMPTMPYSTSSGGGAREHHKYDSLNRPAPEGAS